MPRDLAHLFERVHAAPDDDQARLVLADALTEEGDARGEFIVIQLAEPGGRARGMARVREVQLRRDLGPQWLPPGVQARTARFRRGFPQEVVLEGPTDPGHPGWWTVEQVRIADGVEPLPCGQGPIGGRVRPALRSVLGGDEALVEALMAAPPPRLVQLRFACSRHALEAELAAGLGRVGPLRELEIELPGQPGIPADAGLVSLTTVLRQLGAQLEWLRLPLVSVLPGEVQGLLGRFAPRAEVELVYHDGFGGQGWVRVTAAEASLHVKGRVPEGVVQAMGTVIPSPRLTQRASEIPQRRG